MADLKFITYCGLYCGLCSNRARIPAQATALRDTLAGEGYHQWGANMPNFKEFWAFLGRLCDKERTGPGCRQGCGDPGCEIRKCAQERNIDICVSCDDYPCQHIEALARRYPALIPDGRRLKEIGVEKWIAEQKKRASTGFAYCDIRYQE